MNEIEKDDDDMGKFQYITHDPKVKWNKMRPSIRERYESREQLKLYLTNYAISQGYQIKFKKSDSVRVIVVYASDEVKFHCPYMVRGSWMSTERSFQIKKICDHHSCVRNFNNAKLINPTWLSRQFLKELIRKPNLKCKYMQVIIQSKFHSQVSWPKAYRAKCRALSLIHGKLSNHYAGVWDYGHEFMRSNPGSTIKNYVIQNPDGTTTFQRMYTCFKAISDGRKVGCRRVIGLDGSFLKGQYIENKGNWKWFLELVHDDLELQGGSGICAISDQHKGLLEATKEILPQVEHRQCERHIYANFMKVYNGLEFNNMFWAAAMSTVEGEFKMNIEKIKEINHCAYDHLMTRDPRSWCWK